MSDSLCRVLIAVSTAMLIVIAFSMIVLTTPSMLVGIESDKPIELVIERSSDDDSASKLVNPNTATVEELVALPNLGEVLAERIIEYRIEKGSFTSVDDLLNVDGVGNSRLSLWKPYLTIE